MSLRIKIKKVPQSGPSQAAEPVRPAKQPKRRIDSDDDDGQSRHGTSDEGVLPLRQKRARTDDSYGRQSTEEYADADAVGDVDIEGDVDDTRFLPPAPSVPTSPAPRLKPSHKRAPAQRSKPEAKASGSSKSSGKRQKRAPIVWTDDEDDETEYPEPIPRSDDSDEEFTPEPAHAPPKRGAAAMKAKTGKGSAAAKGGKAKSRKEEKEINIRNERRLPPPVASTSKEGSPVLSSKRPRPKSEAVDSPTPPPVTSVVDTKDIEPPAREVSPPFKKRKLPTIKKNKPANANSTASSTPSSAKLPEKKGLIDTPPRPPLAVGTAPVPRKSAATINNADVDLRDASVYAQLFTKPGSSTPNSGLNRKEKEEERRKELNRMREEARAKRTEEAKQAFDLQAPQEKIQRFEEKLRERNSMARFPNVLGAAFKAIYDRDRTKKEEGELR
ncbi:hypothetical protein B0H21DRAFT_880312 [Amylocystis lapponica]|nr:hypothetical protein B0H21DRAFT_880312 [Amylocystis lapponica]